MQQNCELPKGWKWVNVGQTIDSMKNGIYKPSKYYIDGGIACLRMYNIDQGKIVWKDIKRMDLTQEEITDYLLEPGDLLVNRVNSRELVGKAAVIPNGIEICVFESKNIRVKVNKKVIDPYYLSFYFVLYGSDYFNLNSQQVVGMASISQPQIAGFAIPLPPLLEQHRIVSAIEALFARLDATSERLNRVPDIMKKFRQSVLASAIEGRLTEKWRDENQIKEDSWSDLEFFDFCVLQRGYDLPVSKRIDGRYPIVSSSGILAYHNVYKAPGPGVVVGRSGSTGKVHYIDCDYFPHNTTLFVKDFKGNYQRFVYLFLLNFNLEQYSASTAVPTLNRNNLRGIIVSIPSLLEQQEIVRRVDALFAYADAVEAKVAAAREKTEKLRQSILAKAFSGELVPTEAEIARREGRDYESLKLCLRE